MCDVCHSGGISLGRRRSRAGVAGGLPLGGVLPLVEVPHLGQSSSLGVCGGQPFGLRQQLVLTARNGEGYTPVAPQRGMGFALGMGVVGASVMAYRFFGHCHGLPPPSTVHRNHERWG